MSFKSASISCCLSLIRSLLNSYRSYSASRLLRIHGGMWERLEWQPESGLGTEEEEEEEERGVNGKM